MVIVFQDRELPSPLFYGLLHVYLRPLQFIYLSYELRREEMSHFGIKKKVEKWAFFYFFNFF